MRRLLAWFRAHRIAMLRVIVALWGIHLWMNWAAEREWRQYCEDARLRGVKLTLAEFAPPEIPDAENFAALPMFKGAPLGDTLEKTFALRSSRMPPPCGNTLATFQPPFPPATPVVSRDKSGHRPVNWQEWQQPFKNVGLISEVSNDPLADVLRGFDSYAPQIVQWREWKQRPHCRFPFDVSASLNQWVIPEDPFYSATQAFGWRMRAHLAHGEPVAALDDFRDAFQSYRALREEPTATIALTRLWVLWFLSRQIGADLATHAWAEPELQAIDAELSGVRSLNDYRLALSSERARSMDWFNAWYASSVEVRARMFVVAMTGRPDAPTYEWRDRSIAFAFSGHRLRANQLRLTRYVDELLARISNDGRQIDLDRPTPSAPKKNPNYLDWNYLLLYCPSGYIFTTLENRYVNTQANLHQLRLAIALERYHRAHGTFPEALDSLVPEFLPEVLQDPWSGMPMKYRRDQEDSYVLYSIGVDRKDDGGAFDPKINVSGQHDIIWLYAPP